MLSFFCSSIDSADGLKHWSKEQKKVIDGVLTKKSPCHVSTLCGTYQWVYYGCEDAEDPVITDFEFSGKITFRPRPELASVVDKESLTPRDIYGENHLFKSKGTFDKLKPDVFKGKAYANCWTVTVEPVKILEHEVFFQGFEHYIALSEVEDDDGFPFITYKHYPRSLHGELYVEMIGKRVVEGEDGEGRELGLSDDEQRRLGIGVTVKDFLKALREKGELPEEEGQTEGSEEEDQLEGSDGSDQKEGRETDAADEDKVEIVKFEATARKRKASPSLDEVKVAKVKKTTKEGKRPKRNRRRGKRKGSKSTNTSGV